MKGFALVERGHERPVDLNDAIGPSAAEHADAEANRWIKRLRLCRVEGAPLRERFTHRGDSLWWFCEIYLHRMRVITRAHRAIAALEQVAAAQPDAEWRVDGHDHVVGHLAHLVAARFKIRCSGPADARHDRRGLMTRTKAAFLTATAAADRFRPVQPPRVSGIDVAAFVHSAFLRADATSEAYVGPVIRALQAELPATALHVVGLGPRTNFRVRKWRDRLAEFMTPQPNRVPATNVTSFAGWADVAPSRAVWQSREATYHALTSSDDVKAASIIGGYDVWPIVAEELRGVADLQFPWSARAMDEAGAALDALKPRVVVTYAEAGGWGRALMLEARRRRIASAAIQHGFIYRHWLNYLHEPDEMGPATSNPADRGFPRPDLTLVFDDFAREHLEQQGHFPPASLRVTGSPRLDAIVASARAFDDRGRRQLRTTLGAGDAAPIVLLAAKFTQLGAAFKALVEAVREMPDVRLVVKPHPAEGATPYLTAAGGAPNVIVAPADMDLGRLTSVADALVTANSTAAIEAMPLGVPALVVALPNNLSPFVEAGAMAGAWTLAEIGPTLRALLYDREMRQRLSAARETFLARYRIAADGGAASRAAEAIISLSRT